MGQVYHGTHFAGLSVFYWKNRTSSVPAASQPIPPASEVI
jgi:hypothetical protein